MDRSELKNALTHLQGELTSQASQAPLDPELKQLLGTLDLDIQAVLARGAEDRALGEADLPRDETLDLNNLNAQAQAIEVRFSAEYPRLSTLLRDLMDKLGKMGI